MVWCGLVCILDGHGQSPQSRHQHSFCHNVLSALGMGMGKGMGMDTGKKVVGIGRWAYAFIGNRVRKRR